MFTGIVEQMAEVRSMTEASGNRRLVLEGDGLGELSIGASLSVNGVCLTAAETGESSVVVDVIPETLTRTNLGSLEIGDRVNVERPMPADGRFDGHIVQGHVDGTGVVESIEDGVAGTVMSIRADTQIMRYIVEKGSIAIDGVSLTVAGLSDGGFSVALIPHTLAVTTLGLMSEGHPVNLEVDVLAKYVERLLRVGE